jgi:hypothetical protein
MMDKILVLGKKITRRWSVIVRPEYRDRVFVLQGLSDLMCGVVASYYVRINKPEDLTK